MREVGADIVFLQEVIGEHQNLQNQLVDWPNTSQFEFLADEVWPHHAYGRNAVYDQGHHGNAILSKYPIKSFHNFDISAGNLEQRGLLHAKIEIEDGKSVQCFCTHLALFRKWRRRQYDQICELIEQTLAEDDFYPLIVAGDFNDWEKKACDKLEDRLCVTDLAKLQHGKVFRTFPSFFPMLALDRIYARNVSVKSASVLRNRPWNRLSDHAPLYAEVEV